MIINIGDDILRLSSLGLLNSLLADKTTKKNLMWATDAYRELGEDYERDQEMRGDLISGQKAGIIKTRAQKAAGKKSERTKQHAEVSVIFLARPALCAKFWRRLIPPMRREIKEKATS